MRDIVNEERKQSSYCQLQIISQIEFPCDFQVLLIIASKRIGIVNIIKIIAFCMYQDVLVNHKCTWCVNTSNWNSSLEWHSNTKHFVSIKSAYNRFAHCKIIFQPNSKCVLFNVHFNIILSIWICYDFYQWRWSSQFVCMKTNVEPSLGRPFTFQTNASQIKWIHISNENQTKQSIRKRNHIHTERDICIDMCKWYDRKSKW